MREYEYTVDEALRNGMSPGRTIPVNSPFLYKCLGFRIGDDGPEAFKAGTNPLPAALNLYYTWPYPQFIQGEGYNFLIVRDSTVNHEDAIYTVSDDMATVTSVFSVDVLTFGSYGTFMEVADFGEYAMLVNGIVSVFWNVLGAWNAQLATVTVPLMRTICNLKGQAVGGGITTAWYDCDETFYVWSKIGEMDFTPEDDNEAGYRRCPYGGNIYHVREMGDVAVGYSSKGITFLKPVSSPIPTMGFKKVINVGPRNRGAVNGSSQRQVYVGEDLIIREITEQGIKELGYYYWMKVLDAYNEDIIVSYDRTTGDFYIGNSTRTFLLSPNGMSEVAQHPSTVWRSVEDNIHMLPEAEDSYYPTITSETIDFGYKGRKTIATIETDAVLMTEPEASIDYGDNATAMASMNYKPINHQGVATINGSGDIVRLSVRFDSLFDAFRIGYIKTRFKMTDLRAVRGVYAPPLRGQGG